MDELFIPVAIAFFFLQLGIISILEKILNELRK
jgi:hypothetical protein